MRPIEYHKNILEKDESSHPYVVKCLEFLPNFEAAISKVIDDGIWEDYTNSIEEYDKFLWEVYHNEPQKTNPINKIQNKKYSSFREILLYPLWYRIQQKLNFKTEIILNRSVIQTIYVDDSVTYKDVDGGLGFEFEHNGKKLFLPILVNEDKGGHFCATTASNVNSINRKFKDMNSSIITMTTTDNNITISKDKDYNFMDHTNILFSIRGLNGLYSDVYSSLVSNRFKDVEDSIVYELNSKSISDFNYDKLKIQTKENNTIREDIFNSGLIIKY
jgi:hypothetical protein